MRKRPVVLTLGAVAALVLVALAIYAFKLNRALSREIVSQPWLYPVEIVTTAGGEPLIRLYGDDWRVTEPVGIGELPEFVPKAFMAAEDQRFYRHPGVDPIGLARAMLANLKARGVVQGGSTITQQLIKQKLFTRERTMRRKIPEMILAVLLTVRMSKDEILEGYLNDVYLGEFGGAPVYGVDEASRMYFNKPPAKLRLEEAALLAATIRAPNRDNAFQNPARAKERRNRILATMRERRWISEEEFEEASERRIRLREGDLPDTPFAHYLAAVRTELAETAPALPQSGIRIVVEMDPEAQRAAEEVARRGVAGLRSRHRWLRRDDLQVAILSADPRTGGIRALVGSRDFVSDAFDRTRRMRRQPGSALKPFVYAAALDSRRFTTTSILQDEPLRIELARNRTWSPENYDRQYRGAVTLRQALEQSLNVPTVRLAQQLGLGDVTAELDQFGFHGKFERVPSLPLGVGEVTLREIVSAFSVFPALGEQAPLHLVHEVTNRRGRVMYKPDHEKRRVTDPALAWLMHDLLRGVVMRGTASRLLDAGLAHIAGKTGTTSDYRDAWFIGYAPDLVTGLWIGFDGGRPLRLSAGESAVPLWAAYMGRVPTSRAEIPPPSGVVFADVDPTTTMRWEPGCPGPVREAFLAGTEPRQSCLGAPPLLFDFDRGDTEPPVLILENPGEEVPIYSVRRVRPAHGRIPVFLEDDEDDDEDEGDERRVWREQERVNRERLKRYVRERKEWEKQVREYEKEMRRYERKMRKRKD